MTLPLGRRMLVVGDNGTGSRVEMQWGLTGSRAGYLAEGQGCSGR